MILLALHTLVGASSVPQVPAMSQPSSSDSSVLGEEGSTTTDEGFNEDATSAYSSDLHSDAVQTEQALPSLSMTRQPAPLKAGPSRAGALRSKPRAAGSVQWFLTNSMKRELFSLGYSDVEVSRLDPERAAIILERRIPRPPQGVPSQWNRSSRASKKRAPVQRVVGSVAMAFPVLAVALPVLYDPLVRGRYRELDRWYDGARHTLRRWISTTAVPTRGPVLVDTSPRRRGF